MSDSDDHGCRLTLDEATRVAADLNEFVVAFDRIFSRIVSAEADAELLVSPGGRGFVVTATPAGRPQVARPHRCR